MARRTNKIELQKVLDSIAVLGFDGKQVKELRITPGNLEITRFTVEEKDADTLAPIITEHWTF